MGEAGPSRDASASSRAAMDGEIGVIDSKRQGKTPPSPSREGLGWGENSGRTRLVGGDMCVRCYVDLKCAAPLTMSDDEILEVVGRLQPPQNDAQPIEVHTVLTGKLPYVRDTPPPLSQLRAVVVPGQETSRIDPSDTSHTTGSAETHTVASFEPQQDAMDCVLCDVQVSRDLVEWQTLPASLRQGASLVTPSVDRGELLGCRIALAVAGLASGEFRCMPSRPHLVAQLG